MEWNEVLNSAIGTTFGLIAAILAWWTKEWHSDNQEKEMLLIALVAEISFIKSKIFLLRQEAFKNLKGNEQDYTINCSEVVFSKTLDKLGLIGDVDIVEYLIGSYGLLDELKSYEEKVEQKDKLPLFVLDLDEAYSDFCHLDIITSRKLSKGRIDKHLYNSLEEGLDDEGTDEILDFMFDNYTELATKYYPGKFSRRKEKGLTQ